MAIANKAVLPLDVEGQDRALLDRILVAAADLMGRSEVAPIKTPRINELGNAVEEPLLNACLRVGLPATWPRRSDGSGGRSGYPDIAIDIDGERPAYLEVKVVAAGSESSAFRSFYLSPSERPKVCVDARHLLVAFTHKRRENAADGMEQYTLTSFKIVDLAKVVGKIKFEYQSSNKDMYLGDAVVARG